MKTVIMIAVAGLAMFTNGVWAQQVEISSLDSNGQISWTAPSGSVCSVEWASGLAPSPTWRQDWDGQRNILCTNGAGTVEVPMFFRVNCWTNGLLWHYRMGNTGVLGVTNAYGQCWTQRVTNAGSLDLPAVSSERFSLVWWENTYDESNPPVGLFPDRSNFRRSTDMAVLELADFEREYTIYTNAPVGTTWTYQDSNGYDWEATIETNETITVPAGTFACQRYRKTLIGTSHPTPWIFVWHEPRGGVKKVHNYLLSDLGAAPVVYELLSVEHGN